MCQLNLYIVPKEVNKNLVLDLMKEYFYFQEPECVGGEEFLIDVQDLNNVYISAGMGCNCGTIQCAFQDENKLLSWNDLKAEMIIEEKEKLEQIRKILERPDYLEYKEQVHKTVDELLKKRESATGKEADDLLLEVQKVFSDNKLVYEASMKYEKYKTVNGKEVLYHNIDEEIQNIENSVCRSIEPEYKSLKKFIDEILKETDEIKLLSFWQDGNNPTIKSEKYIFQDELKIEDIIYLKHNELLTIYKRP